MKTNTSLNKNYPPFMLFGIAMISGIGMISYRIMNGPINVQFLLLGVLIVLGTLAFDISMLMDGLPSEAELLMSNDVDIGMEVSTEEKVEVIV